MFRLAFAPLGRLARSPLGTCTLGRLQLRTHTLCPLSLGALVLGALVLGARGRLSLRGLLLQ